MNYKKGDIAFNKYKIIEIQRSANDIVLFDSYKAEHRFIGRPCYLKVFEQTENPNEAQKAIFNHICKMMVIIGEHKNIETIGDLNELESSTYLELEWGGSYYHDPSQGGLATSSKFDLREFLREMIIYAEALKYAHDKKFPHGSLMWRYFFKTDGDKSFFLAGFGHAVSYSQRTIQGKDNDLEAEYLISDGGAGYLSDDQLKYFTDEKNHRNSNTYLGYEFWNNNGDYSVGDRFAKNKMKMDIWAFGATMYHFLTGETIHSKDDFTYSKESLKKSTFLKTVKKKLEKLEQQKRITNDLTSIILKCLQKKSSSKTITTAIELLKGLKSVLSNLDEIDYYWGKTDTMLAIRDAIKKYTAVNESVLILGSPGTGKERIAEMLHVNSPRTDKPFKDVNCAGLPETLIESELFGHVAEAFTGATTDKEGMFESANGGILFLDEVGELPPGSQAKLLRVLEEKKVRKIGAVESTDIDVRVIAASNRPLEKLAYGYDQQGGFFRMDLFERLNILQIKLPDLKDRKIDIPELSNLLFEKICEQLPEGKRPTGIDEAAFTKFQSYDWPGNIRQLRNVITRAVVLAQEKRILTEEDFDLPIIEISTGKVAVKSSLVDIAVHQEREKDTLYWFVKSIEKIEENGITISNSNLMKYFGLLNPKLKDKKRPVEIKTGETFMDDQGILSINIKTDAGKIEKLPVNETKKMAKGKEVKKYEVYADYSAIQMNGQNLNSYIKKSKTVKHDRFMQKIASDPKFYGSLLKVKAFRNYYLEHHDRLGLPTIALLQSELENQLC